MADNLIFPIGFDLEEAVKKAGQEWNSTYADKLEKLLAKRAITVNLGFSTKNLNNLDDVKRRLAELKIEPLTPENKTAIKDLVRELKELAKVMEKVQKYSNIQTPELQQALANKANAEATHMAEKYRQANERVEIAKRRVTLAEQKYADSVFQSSKATQSQTRTYQEQTTYLNRLLKRMATYWSIQQVQTFITSVREVTAQFELQRVSLGAIIQDQARANQLFSEIKAFALKSPASIMDLTKYTKQLAAYKIETDELFETTKKLTDISVGLSVSLDRVILAYGQVRARGALYSSEIRQFTEMGVPIVEELAAKLTKMNGQLVTSAQVLKMVKKGAISFGLVKEVFDDMTSAGGAFYNMQERQGNTLFGMWQKLGDAASVMYDEIGNTGFVNGQMKEAIAILTDLMKNWRYVANAMMMAVPTMLLVHNIEKSRAATSARQIAAMNTLTAATTKRMVAEKALNQAIASGLANTAAKARMNLILAQTEEKVAQKALTAGNSIGLLGKRFNVFGGALKSLSTFVATNFWTILLTGIALVTSALVSANEKANRLKNTLAEIGASGSLELGQSVQNFERLAKIAVESADGSKKQRDALEELHRTYKDMIPVQDMTIEKLRAMDGDYRKLTIAIEEYIRARMKQQQIDAVTSEIGADLAKFERKMTEDAKGFFYTYDKGATKLKLTYDQIQLLIKGIKEIAKTERDLPTRKVFAKALTDYVGLDADNLEVGLDEWLNTFDDGLFGIVRSVRQFEGEIDRIKANETLDTTLGKYAESWKKVNERIENLTVKGAKVGSFTFDRATANASVKQYVGYLKEVLGDAWDESFASIEEHVGANGENMSAIYWEAVMRNWDSYTVAQQNAILKVQKSYDGLLPSDRTVVILREKLQQISGQFGVNMDITKQYLMNAGEDIEAYAKRVKSSLEEAQNNLKELRFNKSQIEAGVGTGVLKPVSDEEIEKADNLTKVLAALFELISAFSKGNSGGGRQSDPRLQNLKEEISLTKKLYDEYHKLEKQIGATKAAEKIQQIYSNTINTLQNRAQKYGFEFKLPFTDENLKANMQHFIDKMKELQGLKDKKGKPLFPNIGKEIDEAVAQLEDVDLNSLQKVLEKKLKDLADRISRTKTAKEFYEKILSQTGDVELATRVSLSIYGSTGEELFGDTVKQIREVFKSGKEDVVIDLEPVFDMTNQRIDYKMLADIYEKYQNDIIEKNRDTAQKIAQEGQKTTASNIANWQKELAKAKDFEQQRTDIIRTAAAEREKIIKEVRDPEERERQLNLSREKESQDLSKLNFEEFTKSEDYIKIFENLDNTATSTLKRLRTELQALIDTNKDLSPENMKTLVKAMEDIDEQISGRGFGNDMVQSVNDYIASIKNLKTAKQELAKAEAEYEAQEPRLDADIETAKAEKESADADVVAAQQKLLDIQTQMAALREQEIIDETQLAALQAQEVAASNALTSAELKQNQAATAVVNAEQAKAKAADKVKKAEQKVSGEQDKQKKATTKFFKDLQQVAATADQLANVLGDVQEALGISEDSAAGLVFDSAIQGLQEFSKIMNVIIGLQTLYNIVTSSNPWLAIAAAVLAVGSILGSWISGSKVRKANKEIERQQELLDQLEYTYGRLEKAADKAFGTDFVANQKQQQKILLAQQQAYMKQYEAEMSKGKKADKEKAQEFLDKARDVGDQIADMQGKIAEQMLGTDLTSAARDFANAWLEAYLSFGSTTDAIHEKFQEMVKNMLVESFLAQTVKNALQPVFDMIDEHAEDGEISEKDMVDIIQAFNDSEKQMDDGLRVRMEILKKLGFDLDSLRNKDSEFSGIAKSIAGATSEEINQLSAFVNTALYYVSPIPTISENVSLIRQLMERGTTSTLPDTTAAGWTDWERQAMDNYIAIARNTADTVVECRRAANACEAATEKLNRALRAKGATIGFNVFLNS